tara:strand:+ start:890 stop:1084 length:195 start_codon:yes stop_codon:yes gene_type:complete
MALPDLTGQNIEDTYQRILQVDSGVVRDGTGSLVPIKAASATSASTATSAATASFIISIDGGTF